MGDSIARRRYNRALARSAYFGCVSLEADGASGRSCGRRLLLLSASLGRLGTRRGLEA